MKFKVGFLGIEAGGRLIVVMDDEDAEALGIHPLDRVEVSFQDKHVTAIVNVAKGFPRGFLGLYNEVRLSLGLEEGMEVEVRPMEELESVRYIRHKIFGRRLQPLEIEAIVKDAASRRLSDVELAAFIVSLQTYGVTMDEAEALARSMASSGRLLKIGRKPIVDKHSIGGVPGDKTTILAVPIIASAGYTIPKTSSRAITSPAGTADRVEVLCPVNLTLEEIEGVVAKTNACMVWGGALELAPADDVFIQAEYPLSIDPLLLPSIMSKKIAVGANYVVIDIPTGRGAKVKTIGEGHALAREFIELGKRLNIHTECAITFGEQPVGYAIGPALEAKEALSTIMGKGPTDLKDKAVSIAGVLFEALGIEGGREAASRLIDSGKAEKKLREIIEAQGGNPKITPEEIEVGKHVSKIPSEYDGAVLWVNNAALVQIARETGAPKDKGAGVLLKAKLGDKVEKGDPLLEVYAETSYKLQAAVKLAEALNPIGVGGKFGEQMLIDKIPAKIPHKKIFILER